MQNFLEDLAVQTLLDLEIPRPIDAYRLAIESGLALRPAGIERAFLDPTTRMVFVSTEVPHQRRQSLVAHEVAEHLLMLHDLPQLERWANYLGAALLVPADDLARDMREFGANIDNLAALYPNASKTLLAGRMAEVMGRGFSMWRQGRLCWHRNHNGRIPRPDGSHIIELGNSYIAVIA